MSRAIAPADATSTAAAREGVPRALFVDPPVAAEAPAQTLPQAIPSHGLNLNAVLYTAAGAGPHPTILLLHGLPGNEQNIDLAQSMRRAGWNVLTIHYRGSWGGPGTFTFAHCLEDAAAAVDWLTDASGDGGSKVDPRRVAIVGHSMGGFVAAHVAAHQPALLGAALISGVDLGDAFGDTDLGASIAVVDENVGMSAGLHILAGTSPGSLAHEARENATCWRLTNYAAAVAHRPVLVVTSDDGFAAGSDALADRIRTLDGTRLTREHLATDHSYSDRRVQLQTILLHWLESFSDGLRVD